MAVPPEQALHVGDQPRSDVQGARQAGLHPVLIDRGGFHTDVAGCEHIDHLAGLYAILDRLANA